MIFIDKELEKKEQIRQVERMAMEDNATISRYSAMQPQDMTYKYNSGKTLQRNYRDFEIYKAMKTDEAQSYGKFQQNADYIHINKKRIGAMPLDEQAEHSLEIDKVILHLCENHLLDKTVDVNDIRLLTDHLMAGALNKENNVNEEVCKNLKNEGIKALEEIYYRELEALSNKYGRNSLINMSPRDYIKALPEIMHDFSCIDDMQKFFATYGNANDENNQMMEVLKFYADSWKCLQKRYMLILNGDFKGGAYAEYSSEMKRVHDTAKKQKLFEKKSTRQTKEIAAFWKIRDERSKKATMAVCNYNEIVKQDDMKMQEAILKTTIYLEQVAQINKDSNDNKISDEEIKRKKEEIMADVAYHMDEVTQENVVEMSEGIFRRIEALCAKVSQCSDEELLNEYTEMRVEYEHLNTEITHMIDASLFVSVRKENPEDTRILPIKTRLSKITQNYPLFGKVESILNQRIKLIQKYGYTNSSDLTDMHDIMEARFGVSEKYKEASVSDNPMSIYEAVQIPRFVNRLGDLSKLDFKVINKELEACRKVKEFRAQQPNFYHLGLSYEEHRRAEAMCELLPYYELAFDLTLQYLGLKDTDQTLMEDIRAEWKAAVDVYNRKSYRIDNSITDMDYKADEMENSERRIKALLENNQIWPEGMKEELKYQIVLAHDFISDESAVIKKQEIEKIALVAEYQEQIANDRKNVSLTDDQFNSFSIMAFRFGQLVDYLDRALEDADYADYKFFELRKDVYSAQREADFLSRFIENEDILHELKGKCVQQGHQEMLKEIFLAFSEIHKRINVYCDYTKALNLEYAKHNGIKEMKVSDSGALGIASADDMLLMARNYKMQSYSEVEKLRVKKLTGENRDAIEKQQKERRIRQGVGVEKIASDAKIFMANLKVAVDLKSLAGNVVGAPLQLFSWVMHEPRTKDHGVAIYDKCQAKYDEMMQNLGENHAMKTASLPSWQRGDAQCSPALDLDELFSSPLKKRIYHALNDEANQNLLQPVTQDMMDNKFLEAMKAIRQYATVVGVVNTDTTEMEMAFLDMFMKRATEYLSTNVYSEDEVIRNRCNMLSEIKTDIYSNLYGTLASTMSEDELNEINEKTIGYVESTIYSKNMEESNIQDIPLFLHEPNINDVKQSSIGDCWLVSAISAVVRTNPEFIKSMFYDTGDGNVIVRLYGIEKNGKMLNSDTSVLYDDKLTTFPTYFKVRKQYETGWGNACDCTWVQLLEKAYALSGFNGRKEMSVKGNKLYNVVDELTYGHQGIALMHLTGKQPDNMAILDYVELSERSFYSTELIASIFDGFTPAEINSICTVLFNAIPTGEQVLKNDIEFFVECSRMIANSSEEMNQNVQRVMDNIQKIKNKEQRSERYQAIKDQIKEVKQRNRNVPEVTFGNLNEREVVNVLYEYFEKARNANYTPAEDFFYRTCKKVFDEHKTISAAIPHCVDFLDAKEHNGKYFILMRDPFNIYNYKYTMEGPNVNVANEGFMSVISGHKENRYLTGGAQDIIHYGFRGTSWVELKDLYKIVVGIFAPKFND